MVEQYIQSKLGDTLTVTIKISNFLYYGRLHGLCVPVPLKVQTDFVVRLCHRLGVD